MSARNQNAAKTYRFGGVFKPSPMLNSGNRQSVMRTAVQASAVKNRAVFHLVQPLLFFTAGFLNIVKE
jgi:hypothetical protein